MEKSVKDQALEAMDKLEADVPADNEPKTPEQSEKSQGGSVELPEDDMPAEKPVEVPAEEEQRKPEEQNQEPKTPTTIELDGQSFSLEDIKKFREDSLNKENWQKELTQKSQEFSQIQSTMDKLKDVFVEKKENNQELSPEEEKFRQETELFFSDKFVQQKIKEQVETKFQEKIQAEEQLKTVEKFTQEIKKLEEEFNGNDGRPKYVDAEVLKWQKDNNRLHLNPREAYELKHKDQLIEWEIEKRLKNKGGVPPKPTTAAANAPKVEGEKTSISGDKFERRNQLLDMFNQMDPG